MSYSHQFGKWLSNPPPGEEVVISGISGRFPESENIQEFQENLFNRRDMVTDDGRRWKINNPEIPQRSGKINHINKLDAGYFGLHYRQADIMDPMMRKLLEVTLEAVMDAGINPSELEGSRTAVCMGISYAEVEIETLKNITEPQAFGVTGYFRSCVAHRLSYFLKLKGPSCISDSACSSSLNALELAFKMIREGQCDQAIVGSGNLLLHPGYTRQFFRLGVLSSDGVAKVFDNAADGYVKGEAISCILLQKSKNARRIYAQVVHAKVKSDGFTPSGITFPSSQLQEELMTEVLEESGVHPNELSYMEAHGTGTTVGDPQEVEAIDKAIARRRNRPLLTGSVKSSVGHSEPSSGLSSVIKVIIVMETGSIPPNLHFKNVKKGMLGFEEGRMIPVTETLQLGEIGGFIGINNFGFGGNNSHVLLQGHTKLKKNKGSPQDDLPRLVCVSGRTQEAVKHLLDDINQKPLDCEYVGLLHQIFKKEIKENFYRGFTIVSKTGPIKSDLKSCFQRKPLRIFFGRFEEGCGVLGKFLTEFPCFRSTISRINDLLGKQFDLYEAILKPEINNHQNAICSFAVQIALVEILKLLEIEASSVYGNSLGKFVAAYYYENIDLKQALNAACGASKESEIEAMIPRKGKLSRQQNFRKDSLTLDDLKVTHPETLLLNISDEAQNGNPYRIHFEDHKTSFLEVLGRLYEEGHNPQIHKLYPPVQFPVSRTTPMISPQIQWNHGKNWFTYKFGEFSGDFVAQKEFSVSAVVYEEQKYMTGHVIDGRNLVPATAYLDFVWQTFLQVSELEQLPVVLEDCRFIRAVTLPKTGYVKLLVSIQKSSGKFEITEKDSIIVTGRIFTSKDVEKFCTTLPTPRLSDNKTDILDQDEIYRELYLRGYNYSGLFKGIVKSSVDGTVGLVQWENNWITFLDKMLQMKILQMDTRLLYVPVGIKRMVINPFKHELFVKKENQLCPVYSYQECNIIKSGGVEIQGLQAAAISRRKLQADPVLEKYVFFANDTQTTLDRSARISTQIIIENSLVNAFKAVEVVDDFTSPNSELLLPLIAKALDDLPSVTVNLTISSKAPVETTLSVENSSLSSYSNLLLVVASKIFQRPEFLNEALNSLSPDGFLLTREDLNFVPNDPTVEIITQHATSSERCFLLKKIPKVANSKFVEVTSGFDWLSQVQEIVKDGDDVVIYGSNQEPNGLFGLVNCLRREPEGRKIRCALMMDSSKFDPQNLSFEKQLRKRLAFNVFQDGKWGTYRHMLLEEVEEVKCEHVFAQNIVKGDLSSLKWVQGPLTSKTAVSKNSLVIFPYYCGINFKDIMLASGRVSISSITNKRLDQECPLGFEFSGCDNKGRRIMAMTASKSTATLALAEKDFFWEIPESWTLEDASTVVVVYCTVLYALFKVIAIKPGMSILIHSATGGIGLAALNVCLHHGCNIFVTVGTQDKKEYLRKYFPQIPESHFGNSRDTSFEEMIKIETQGRGVDVVLNSLSEDKLKASVRSTAPGGHFLELGKFDLGNDSLLDMIFLERNVSYHGVMLDRVFDGAEILKSWLVEKLYEGMKLGYVKPLPRTVYRMDEVMDAYKYMTTGRHVGKVLIKIRNENEKIDDFRGKIYRGYPRFSCDFEKSYIIVGGLGGFGLELADWLYLRGAKKLILVSRSGIQTGYQVQRIRNWNASGVTVQISTEDITTIQGCINLIKQAKNLGPIDAIFNLAVILKDALFEDQTQETFKISFAPKAEATKNLDQVTREYCPDLRHFVVFSSVSCGRGNPGQTNYGMANSVMERICEKRKLDGFPALAIQWGAIGDVGLVAKMQKENKELVIGGTLQQKISSCLEVLDKFLNQTYPVVSSMVVAEKIDKTSTSGSAAEAVASVLGIRDLKLVSPHTSFAELGMDSMMATEVIQVLEKNFEIYINAKEARSLTFSKLMELQEDMKLETTIKVEKNKQDILRRLPVENTSDRLIVKMSSQPKNNKVCSIFVLTGLEGALNVLETLSENLTANVYGIEYDNRIKENSIEDIAKRILPLVEDTVSREEKFFLIGYSFGVLVATELIALLESRGFVGKLVAIDGSPSYITRAAKEHFPDLDSKNLQTTYLFKVLSLLVPVNQLEILKEKFVNCQSFEERIDLGLSILPEELKTTQRYNKEAIVGCYHRCEALLNYKFGGDKIKSSVYLYRAKMSMVGDIQEDYQWSEVCQKMVKVTLLDGDHCTILNHKQLVEDVNNLLTL